MCEKIRASIKAKHAGVFWDIDTKEIRVADKSVGSDMSRVEHLHWSGGACHVKRYANPKTVRTFLAVDALHLIIRYKLDPISVHKEFLKIYEYQDMCALDMPGVTREPDDDDD